MRHASWIMCIIIISRSSRSSNAWRWIVLSKKLSELPAGLILDIPIKLFYHYRHVKKMYLVTAEVWMSMISTQKLSSFLRERACSHHSKIYLLGQSVQHTVLRWELVGAGGSNRCRVPAAMSKHVSKLGKPRTADRGINKVQSQAILKNTGIFVAVGSGEYSINLQQTFKNPRICNCNPTFTFIDRNMSWLQDEYWIFRYIFYVTVTSAISFCQYWRDYTGGWCNNIGNWITLWAEITKLRNKWMNEWITNAWMDK